MTPLALGTASRNIALPRGSTPRLRVLLVSRNVRSGVLAYRPGPRDTVEWRIGPPGTAPKTTAPGGGLKLDPRTRVIECPFTEAERDALPATGQPYAITVVNAAGQRFWFLEGVITAVGSA